MINAVTHSKVEQKENKFAIFNVPFKISLILKGTAEELRNETRIRVDQNHDLPGQIPQKTEQEKLDCFKSLLVKLCWIVMTQ